MKDELADFYYFGILFLSLHLFKSFKQSKCMINFQIGKFRNFPKFANLSKFQNLQKISRKCIFVLSTYPIFFCSLFAFAIGIYVVMARDVEQTSKVPRRWK